MPAEQQRYWSEVEQTEQTRLLDEYNAYLDGFPPTCDITTKNERFSAWLLEREIIYPG